MGDAMNIDRQAIFLVTQQLEEKYTRVGTLRDLAGSEETYRLIMREVDRVKSHLLRARTIGAAATLTFLEWFNILEGFEWKCAYCQEKPFQILSHKVRQAQGGTTAENCVPACYRCLSRRRPQVTLFQRKNTPPHPGTEEGNGNLPEHMDVIQEISRDKSYHNDGDSWA